MDYSMTLLLFAWQNIEMSHTHIIYDNWFFFPTKKRFDSTQSKFIDEKSKNHRILTHIELMISLVEWNSNIFLNKWHWYGNILTKWEINRHTQIVKMIVTNCR